MAYVIQRGDTLSALARKYNTSVQDLMKLNPDIKNANLIIAGKSLNVPEQRTLEGTLNEQQETTSNLENISSPVVPSGEKTLPQQSTVGSLAAFKSLLRDVSAKTYKAPSVSDVLAKYKQQGVNLAGGAETRQIFGTEQEKLARPVADIYNSTIEMMTEKIKKDEEFGAAILQNLPASVLATLTGDEFSMLKSGATTPELQTKLQTAILKAEAEKKEKGFQYIQGNENQPAGVFDPNTGTFKPQTTSTTQQDTDTVIKYQDGEYGGQCGVFTRKIIPDVPLMGDTIETKKQMINNNGILSADWVKSPAVGDVLIFDTKRPYGHAAVVNSVNQDGTVTLTESNWNNDEKVTNTRKVSISDPSIYGAYRSSKPLPGSTTDFEQYSQEQIALAVLPTQLKNSEAELKRALTGIRAGLKEGKTPYQIADTLMGYKITNPTAISDNLRKYLSIGDFTNSQIMDVARLLNAGDNTKAVTKIEQQIMESAKKADPDSYMGEATARLAVSRAKALQNTVEALGTESPVGVVKGTMESWMGRFRGKDAQNVKTQITNLVAEMRNRLSGTAVTKSEEAFLESIIPKLGDSPDNFMIKLNNLRTQPLMQLNEVRATYELPQLTEQTLINKDSRVALYGGETNEKTLSDEDAYQLYLQTVNQSKKQ